MNKKSQPRGKAFWPLLGFLLAVSSAILAYFFTNPLIIQLRKSLRNFPTDPKVPIIVGVTLFALFVMIFSLMVAVAIPRKKGAVTEIQVAKSRKAMVNEKMARKIKQRNINRQGKAR